MSQGKGPSAAIPLSLAASTAGLMWSISCRPKLPHSPLWGFRAQTARRGVSMPDSQLR